MENETKKLRLIQVAKEFKVGLNTVTDFLRKKGVAIDGSPNTQISGDIYAMVEKEFGANRTASSARDSVREKISTKQATVSIEETKPVEPKRTIEVKDEVQQPKILGRVELDKNGNIVKPQPKAEPKPEVKAEPKPEPKAEVKPQPAPQPKAEPVAETKENGAFRASATPTLSGPQILGKIDVSGMVPGGKRRKKIDKEKVDITRQQPQQGGGKKNKPEFKKEKDNNFNNNNNQQGGGKKNKHNKPQLTAEVLYRYLTNNIEFVESHTGLEDVEIEMQIFLECKKRNPDEVGLLW